MGGDWEGQSESTAPVIWAAGILGNRHAQEANQKMTGENANGLSSSMCEYTWVLTIQLKGGELIKCGMLQFA